MPNTNVQAAGEAMPTFNRRSLLRGLAAASIAAGGASVAAASPVVPLPVENEELIRLGNDLPAIIAAFTATRASLKAITDKWSPRWPVAPDEILMSRYSYGMMERSLTGHAIERELDGKKVTYGLLTTKDLERHMNLARGILKGKTVDSRKIRGKTRSDWELELAEDTKSYSIAERYEKECQRIRDASGYDAADAAFRQATKDLAAIISSIMAQQDYTMAGIVIKAQALSMTNSNALFFETCFEGKDWASEFSASVLRIASGNAGAAI